MTDEQIVDGCIKKNAIAQKYLYDKFSRKMMGVCLRYCDNEDEAQDILQNGFISVFEHIESFKGTGALEGWIKKIMVNTALTSIRKNKKFRQNIELGEVEFMLPSSNQTNENIKTKDLLMMIQSLPHGSRTIFNLHAIEGYSHVEIANMLNISEGTSKSQYSRARTHLQKIISLEDK
jgi:RNA polymerase sigma factor (sigma-70 family)